MEFGHWPIWPQQTNKNGEQLLDFYANHDLIVSNTWFQHKSIHQLTWYRNNDRSKAGYLIDLLLINRNFDLACLTRVSSSAPTINQIMSWSSPPFASRPTPSGPPPDEFSHSDRRPNKGCGDVIPVCPVGCPQ